MSYRPYPKSHDTIFIKSDHKEHYCVSTSSVSRNKQDIPFFETNMHGWSKRKFLKELHSWSSCGSRHKHVGLKNGNNWRVLRAAWHFVTVTVEHDTETQRYFSEYVNCTRYQDVPNDTNKMAGTSTEFWVRTLCQRHCLARHCNEKFQYHHTREQDVFINFVKEGLPYTLLCPFSVA